MFVIYLIEVIYILFKVQTYFPDRSFIDHSWRPNIEFVVDGKYVVLPSGELQIRNVSAEDGFKTYKCRTKHRLTGETKLSATAGRLVITGKILNKFNRMVRQKLNFKH